MGYRYDLASARDHTVFQISIVPQYPPVGQLNFLHSAKITLLSVMSRSSSAVDNLQTSLSKDDPFRKDNAILRERVSSLEDDVVTLKEKTSQLTAEVVTLKEKNSQLTAVVVTLTGRMENLERQLQLVFQRTSGGSGSQNTLILLV
ncbi:hypothetical protein BT69DRAFT_1329294 [Atractiella rhizophila]|nr:hypothetical protein BT69DRAFT_1329294 [Atractiella rhizophila]